jgi:alpha-L-fucosidase
MPKTGRGLLVLALLWAWPALEKAAAAGDGQTTGPAAGGQAAAAGAYQPTWESLTKHPDPEWFDEAKFGIYFHWGVYSVPAYGTEWYSRNMYQKGSRENRHHLATYGPLSKFGYKDFIPMFTAEKFDPDEWAELFEKAGAKFAGPVAEHADGFAMWDSRLTKWNAARMGPRRDIVGEMARAVRKRGLKFIATFHHQWLWGWYPTYDKDVDASMPACSGLYGPAAPASAFHPRNDPKPSRQFCELWEAKVKEVIDKYQPDLLWFDSRMTIIDDACRKDLLAYYYNRARQWGRQVGVTYKDRDLPPGAGMVDLERGRMAAATPYKWLNDDSIDWKSWCYVQDASYKSADRLVDELVDIVSKNGNLLLNIGPKADGEIPQPVRHRLLAMGQWLRVNGEAIYGTRPWEVHGEGPTKVKGGHFGEGSIGDFTAEDIRFTAKGRALYAVLLAWPGERAVITSLHSGRKLWLGEVGQVRMLGAAGRLEWSRDAKGLTVRMPARKPCEHAFVLKITAGG